MKRLAALRAKKTALIQEATDITAKIDAGTASAEDEARLGAILKPEGGDLAAVNGQIATEEQLEDARRSMPAASNPNADTVEERNDRSGRTVFAEPKKEERRFGSLGEQMLAVAKAASPNSRPDDRLIGVAGNGTIMAAPTGLNEAIGADGGFLVQQEFVGELMRNVYEGGEVLSRVRRITVGPNSNGIVMNGVDETSRANGSRAGGILTYWTPEAGLKTASQPKFKQVKMELEKLTGLCYATDELLQDSVALEAWLRDAFQEEMIFRIEDAIINGTGAGMPLGILNSGAVVLAPKSSGSQPAATIDAANILAMWSRLPARSRRNAVWLVNVDTEPQLGTLYTPVKNVAGTENVGGIASVGVTYIPPGVNGNAFGTLQGRPVIPIEQASTLGTAGDILLVDLSQYLAIDKGGMQTAVSIHVRFIYDETCFRFVYRFNGMPLWRTAVTPYKGTNTQSPFVALTTR